VGITYLTGRALWDRETGMYAAFMLPGIPYIFSQTPLMLVDVPTMFFLTLSVYTFIRAIENGGKWIVFTSLAVFSAILSKYSSWMMLST
jgi:4-amino-4-deoxy-L-arabinose transferase-like glycosyltransferase